MKKILHGPDQAGNNDMSIADIFYEMVALTQFKHDHIASMKGCTWDWEDVSGSIYLEKMWDHVEFYGPRWCVSACVSPVNACVGIRLFCARSCCS